MLLLMSWRLWWCLGRTFCGLIRCLGMRVGGGDDDDDDDGGVERFLLID